MEHRGEKRGKQAGSGIRRRATFHEGLEHFVKYYVFTKKKRAFLAQPEERHTLETVHFVSLGVKHKKNMSSLKTKTGLPISFVLNRGQQKFEK